MLTPNTNDQNIINFIEDCQILVVIVSYQTGKLVINNLKSLIPELSEQPFMKVIVVDNTCGQDAKFINRAIIENGWQDWVTIIVSPRNGGFSYGNNLAIRYALSASKTPKYIWLLNPDTQIRPGAGSYLVDFLDNNVEVGIAGSCLINRDGNEWGVAFRFPSIISEMEHALQFGPVSRLVEKHIVAIKMGDESCQVGWLPGASMMIRTDVFNSTGLFDEDYFLYYEETDFCLNALSNGWTTWYIPESKVMHIAGQSTGATGFSASTKRLPQYMFDSRNHYFSKNHGFLYATVTDIVRIISLVLNKVIIFLRGNSNKHHPYLLWDSILNFNVFKRIKRLLIK